MTLYLIGSLLSFGMLLSDDKKPDFLEAVCLTVFTLIFWPIVMGYMLGKILKPYIPKE